MSKEDIDEIVLVGGTTRIPLVKQQLKYVCEYLNPSTVRKLCAG